MPFTGLNSDERGSYDLAARNGFALVDGTGHRRERKGSPLLNILRQRADALSKPSIWVERHRTGDLWYACIDYSPTRPLEATQLDEMLARTLRVVEAESIAFESIDPPWPLDAGATAVLPQEDDALSLPIWCLEACVARFGFRRAEDAQQKDCKRLAKALASEFQSQIRP